MTSPENLFTYVSTDGTAFSLAHEGFVVGEGDGGYLLSLEEFIDEVFELATSWTKNGFGKNLTRPAAPLRRDESTGAWRHQVLVDLIDLAELCERKRSSFSSVQVTDIQTRIQDHTLDKTKLEKYIRSVNSGVARLKEMHEKPQRQSDITAQSSLTLRPEYQNELAQRIRQHVASAQRRPCPGSSHDHAKSRWKAKLDACTEAFPEHGRRKINNNRCASGHH